MRTEPVLVDAVDPAASTAYASGDRHVWLSCALVDPAKFCALGRCPPVGSSRVWACL